MTVFQPPLVAAEQRAWNYWFVDGITNLVVGANTLLFALTMMYPPRWPPRPLPIALWLVALVLYVVVALYYRQIVEWLKARTTYPRTGYVESPSADPAEAANLVTFSLGATGTPPEVQLQHMQRRARWMITIALVAVACFAFMVIHQRWVWTATGTLFSIAMIIARRTFRFSWILPVGFPLLGLYITTFAPRHMGGTYLIIGMGMLFILDGAATLITYLIRNPMPKAPAA